MLSCKEAIEVCSAEQDRPLKMGERVSLRMHLLMCSGCTNYRKQLHALRKVSQAYAQGRATTVKPEESAE
jgi:putative zinc finger protein